MSLSANPISPIPRALLRVLPTIMLAISIANIIIGFASTGKNSALQDISGDSISIITNITFGVWMMLGVIHIAVAYSYTRFNPSCAAANLVTVLTTMTLFTSYLAFGIRECAIWGPFATVLGIITRAGLEAIYDGVGQEKARVLWNNVWGSDDNSTDTGNGTRDSSGGPVSHPWIIAQRRRIVEGC